LIQLVARIGLTACRRACQSKEETTAALHGRSKEQAINSVRDFAASRALDCRISSVTVEEGQARRDENVVIPDKRSAIRNPENLAAGFGLDAIRTRSHDAFRK
jgi:hypothetical protein